MTTDTLNSGAASNSDAARPSLPSRSAEVYEELRTAIAEGHIRPRERLIETELAERLNVSRTPIRESLQRLAADGLVTSHRRGWIVREHSPQEVTDLYEVRAALEGYAARLTAERATDEQLREIEQRQQRCRQAVEHRSRADLVDTNADFHDAVVDASGNARLAEQIRGNTSVFFSRRVAGFLTDDEVEHSVVGHQPLVDALLSRDGARAEEVARALVLESMRKTLAHLSRRP